MDVPSDVLRNDAFCLALGELIGVAGLLALILQRLRRHAADRSGLWFGLASVLYGLRLLLSIGTLQTAFPHFPWHVAMSAITLVVPYPFILFLGATLARAYPWYTRFVLCVTLGMSLFGAVRLILGQPMDPAWFLNGVITVATVFGWIIIGLFPRIPIDAEVNAIRIGLLVMGLSAVYQNLWVMKLAPPAGWVEPLGVAYMLGTFLFVSASRSIRAEAHLIALHNELDIARRIQAQALPKLGGAISGFDIHARYSPAGSVAGDFYDVLSTPRGAGVLIADVSGHGVPAALSASMLKLALRAHAGQMECPAAVMSGLNRSLCEMLDGQFVTAAYVYFDAGGHTLTYAGAGHPPLLLWRAAAQQVESLEHNGLFLGPFPSAEYSEVTAPFSPGDRCLLYTDGVVEAANRKGEEFGAERLIDFLRRKRDVPAHAACDALLVEIGSWSGAGAENQQDDITFVVVEFQPDPRTNGAPEPVSAAAGAG